MDNIVGLTRNLGLGAESPRQRSEPLDDSPGSSSQGLREIPYEYRYRRFPDEKVIRILTLNPGRWDDRLVGSLEFADLNHDPDFEAISYTWGDPLRCREMLVDGKVFPLTKSLRDTLRAVRHVKRPRRVWVDQICINQRSTEE